jgi:hypothetical protein
VQIDDSKILGILRDLWQTQLGLSLNPAVDEPEDEDAGPKLATCVKVSGAWEGSIVLECPEPIARHASAMLFESDGEETSGDDAHDAVVELARMVASKIQPLLPLESKLSGVAKISSENALEGMRDLNELRLSSEGHPVRFALLENESQPVPAG